MGAFRVLTGASSVLLGVLLVWGSLHHSSEPIVLGRYSAPYAAALATLAVMLAWVLFAFARPGSRPAGWLRNVYLVLFATLLPLAAVEIGLRAFDPWGVSMFDHLPYHMQGMVDHPLLGYEHPKSVEYALGPNLVRLNAHGLRMDETVPYAKPPGERRILALGDSTTFGWGVSQGETFSDSLQRRLRASAQEPWTVINAGVNGYNTEQEVEYFFLTGRRYQPDIVLVMFNANDVEPRVDPNTTSWRRYPTWPESLPELADRVRQMSYVYQLPMLLAKAQMMDLARKSGSASASAVDDPGWPIVAGALARLRDACADSGIHLLVAMQSGADSKVAKTIASMDIEVLTLEAAWKEIPPDRRHVSRIDPHPSREGHEQIGRVAYEELRRRGWLDAADPHFATPRYRISAARSAGSETPANAIVVPGANR